jgi:glycosyltransferase involved in cell wall biosynthesis
MLATALWSIEQQTVPVQVVLAEDPDGWGAASTRQAGLDVVQTPWVAFLDSDDWLYPDHVETLTAVARVSGSDYVYSYFTPHDQWEGARGPDCDPLGLFGHRFDPAAPTQTTSTILVRTELAQEVGFREQPDDRTIPESPHLRYGEDFDFTVRCANMGANIRHVPRRTWAWRIGRHNTSGQPGRGDATP